MQSSTVSDACDYQRAVLQKHVARERTLGAAFLFAVEHTHALCSFGTRFYFLRSFFFFGWQFIELARWTTKIEKTEAETKNVPKLKFFHSVEPCYCQEDRVLKT